VPAVFPAGGQHLSISQQNAHQVAPVPQEGQAQAGLSVRGLLAPEHLRSKRRSAKTKKKKNFFSFQCTLQRINQTLALFAQSNHVDREVN
jgi:predicted RNA-binding protein with RPS1 domain